MFHHQSAYLDRNLYRAGYPGHIDQVSKFRPTAEKYVNTYIRPANWGFGNADLWHCYRVARVAFRAEEAFRAQVLSALESAVYIGQLEMHLFRCVSTLSVDSVWCHFGKEGIHPSGFDEAWPGVFQLQPWPIYTLENWHPTSSLFGLRREDSWSDIGFPLLRRAKTPLWTLWRYSRRGAYWTVPAVPDLLS